MVIFEPFIKVISRTFVVTSWKRDALKLIHMIHNRSPLPLKLGYDRLLIAA